MPRAKRASQPRAQGREQMQDRSMGRRGALAAGVAAGGTTLAAPHVARAQTVTWKMATGWAGGPLMDIGAKAFADRVALLTDNRVRVQTFPGGALGNALRVTETVKNGVAECGHTWMGYDWGADTTTVMFGGYAGSMDTDRMLHWLYEAGGADMQREFRMEKFGVVSFPLFIRTAEAFLHSRKPVRSLDDLKGLKLRTAGSWIEMSRSLGAAPVTTPGGEIYTALERGVIDATEWGTLWENISTGFHRVAKYVIIPGVHQPTAPFELVVNPAAWNRLSDRDRQLVALAARTVTFDTYLKVGNEDAKALDFYRKAGNEIIELSPETIQAARRIAREWAEEQAKANPWFARALKSQDEFEALWRGAEKYRTVPALQT
jgi:TRAP-type mannitol/chloroaromatic compound transport system substrate-binding protein